MFLARFASSCRVLYVVLFLCCVLARQMQLARPSILIASRRSCSGRGEARSAAFHCSFLSCDVVRSLHSLDGWMGAVHARLASTTCRASVHLALRFALVSPNPTLFLSALLSESTLLLFVYKLRSCIASCRHAAANLVRLQTRATTKQRAALTHLFFL